MCFITLVPNPLILRTPVTPGSPWQHPLEVLPKYINGVPCWIAYCSSTTALNSTTTDRRFDRGGGQPVWPVPPPSNGPWFEERQKQEWGQGDIAGRATRWANSL
jgi:hypothetical protein